MVSPKVNTLPGCLLSQALRMKPTKSRDQRWSRAGLLRGFQMEQYNDER